MKTKPMPQEIWIIYDLQAGDFVGYYVSKHRALAEAAHYYYTRYDLFGKESEVPSFIQVSQFIRTLGPKDGVSGVL